MKETKFKQTLVQTKEGSRHCEEHSDVPIQGGFKMTELGLVPSDWENVNISKTCTIKARIGWQGLKSTEYLNSGDYILVTGTDFKNGFIDWSTCSYVSEWRFKQDKNIQIKKGDVLVTKDGTIGKVAFLNEIPMEGTLNSGVFVVRSKDLKKIDSVYLSLVFKSSWFDNFLDEITSGSTIVHLYQKDFVKFNFPIPSSIEEQQRIANALSDVDTLINNLEKLIAKKKNIKQGAMQQLLTGRKRLPGFGSDERQKECHSERSAKREVEKSSGYKMTELGLIPIDWEVKKLSSVCTIIMGQSPDSKYYNEKEGTPLIQGNADIENRETFVRFYTTQITKKGLKGDLILTVRAPVGSVAKATFDCCLGRGVCALRNASDFLYQYLIYIEKEWAKRSAGSTFDSIKSDELSATLVVVPSSKEEQTAIANVLSDMDTEISVLETKLAKYRKLKTGMMQQLLTGKIRLV